MRAYEPPGSSFVPDSRLFLKFADDETWHLFTPNTGWLACGIPLTSGTTYIVLLSTQHPGNEDLCPTCVRTTARALVKKGQRHAPV